MHPAEKSERFFANFKKFAAMIKRDPRFKITTYGEIAERLKKEPERVVALADIPEIKRQLEKAFYPLKSPKNLSISDIFLSCRSLLLGEKTHTCGMVKGLLSKPYAITSPVTVRREEMIKSAESIDPCDFIPEKIRVGGKVIGPADWIRAALDILLGKDFTTILPGDSMPSFSAFSRLESICFKGGWMQSDEFMDNYISDRLRLQAYTMRFPEI